MLLPLLLLPLLLPLLPLLPLLLPLLLLPLLLPLLLGWGAQGCRRDRQSTASRLGIECSGVGTACQPSQPRLSVSLLDALLPRPMHALQTCWSSPTACAAVRWGIYCAVWRGLPVPMAVHCKPHLAHRMHVGSLALPSAPDICRFIPVQHTCG